jgi:general secretion pathway protein C
MLDLYLRKYAWTAKLLLLFTAAWLAAKTVNTAVGAAIRPTPRLDLTALPIGGSRAQMWTQLEVDKLYPLIGQKPPAVASTDGAAAAPPQRQTCGDRLAPPVKTGLRARLVAGVIAEEPRWSIASITDLASRDTRVYGIGDSVLGAALLSVERIRDEHDGTGQGFKVVAIICNNGQKEFVDFESAEGAALASAPSLGVYNPPPPGGIPAPVEGVKSLGDNRYELQHRLIESTLSNLNSISTQARIVPSFKNGAANGFKLFSIQPGSLYAAIGVENGDVIQKINGYEINSPDKALEVYQKLRDSRHITLEIERNGQALRKEYNVTGP